MKHAIIFPMSAFITIDIGGTQIRVAVYGPDGIKPLKQKRIPTRSPRETAVQRMQNLIQELWPTDQEVVAIGIGAPGQVDTEKGIIATAPNIDGWINLPLRQILEDQFHVPVFLGNDANLAALAEWKYGAGQGHHHVLYLTVSTGIGAGVIIDDRLLVGWRGLATELGHVTVDPNGPLCGCGKPGHLESFSSGTGIAHYVSRQLAGGVVSSLQAIPSPSARDISLAAQQGDPLAIDALARAGHYLGLAVTSFLHSFNPSVVILGGGVSQSGEFLLAPMRATMRRTVLSPAYLDDLVISLAALGDDAGLLGALVLARSEITQKSLVV